MAKLSPPVAQAYFDVKFELYIEVPGSGFVSLKGEKDPFPDPPGSHFKVIFVLLFALDC